MNIQELKNKIEKRQNDLIKIIKPVIKLPEETSNIDIKFHLGWFFIDSYNLETKSLALKFYQKELKYFSTTESRKKCIKELYNLGDTEEDLKKIEEVFNYELNSNYLLDNDDFIKLMKSLFEEFYQLSIDIDKLNITIDTEIKELKNIKKELHHSQMFNLIETERSYIK